MKSLMLTLQALSWHCSSSMTSRIRQASHSQAPSLNTPGASSASALFTEAVGVLALTWKTQSYLVARSMAWDQWHPSLEVLAWTPFRQTDRCALTGRISWG